ncbi:MAG: hypothetical protein IJU64_06385 [Bacilli bacterium]|nr:hypothetical protein [Bacilli bacterium]
MRMNKCSIISSVIAIALCGCSSPIRSGNDEPVITGISANIHLLYNGEEKQCPHEGQGGQTVYYVTTLKQYTLTAFPLYTGSKAVAYKGDVVTFDDCYEGTNSARYGSFTYLNDDKGNPTYRVQFTLHGTFDVHFTIGGFKSSIKVICDNQSSKYEDYRGDISDIYPWMKDLNTENIGQVRFESSAIGIEPGSLRSVSYTNDSSDINNLANLLNAKIMRDDVGAHHIDGGGYNLITFYQGSNAYDLRIYNGFVDGNESVSANFAYQIQCVPGTTKISNPYQECLKLLTYGKNSDCAVKSAFDDSVVTSINYLQDIEFEPWGEAPMNENQPEFYIDDGLKVSDRLYIFAEDRFEYNHVYYRIISDVNFASLFSN